MKRSMTRAIAVVLTVALAAGAFAGCSKKKSKSIEDAVDEFSDGFEEYSIDDLKGLDEDTEALQDGILIKTSGEELSENGEINDALDSATSDFGISIADMIDIASIGTVKVAVQGNPDLDEPVNSSIAIIGCAVFDNEDDAVKFFDDIDSLLRMAMAVTGYDMDDFSEEEYFFDEDKGEASVTINITMEELISGIYDKLADMFGDSVTANSDKVPQADGSVVIGIRLDGDSILFSVAVGDEYVDKADDVYDAAGLDKPSEVENSEEVKSLISDLLANTVMNYLFQAFSAMSDT